MTLAALAASALLAALDSAGPAAGQGFGENHVVLRDFAWQIRSTEHFDIHYYEGSAPLVPEAARMLEGAYRKLNADLTPGFTERRPFFLYASVNDMQQSNITQVGDGTGGVTESFKDRFMVYNDGSSQWLEDVTTHELVHEFQFHVLISGFWKSARILKSFVYPLWFMEGMAEHFTSGLDDSTQEVYVRDAATSGGLIPLWKLEHFSHLKPHQVTLAYKSGASALDFLASQYGSEKIGEMLRLFESHFEAHSVLQDLLGVDEFQFDSKWREYLTEKYRRLARIERLQEPTEYGARLTPSSGDIPEFNAGAVLTPDGRSLAYLTTREGHPPALYLQDLTTGRRRRLVARAFTRIENVELGNFTNLSRVLAVSPDGRRLAFFAQKNHRDSLYLYDLRRGSLDRVDLPGFMTAKMPAFSPDAATVAFSGMKDARTDIYLLDLKTGRTRQLTSDPQDDQSPNFAPDGESIVYSSEVEVPDDPMEHQRRLYRIRLSDLTTERIADLPGAARDPVQSPDGSRVLFALEGGGFHDLYELDLASGRALRLTRSLGGSYSPVYAPNGDVVFSSFRRGSVHVYRATRSRLLAEPVAASEARRPSLTRLPGLAPPAGSWGQTAVSASTSPALGLSAARPYKFKASTDLFLPAFFYSSQGGLFWTSYWQGSDMLGNHQATALAAIASGQGYINYQTQYDYSRFRPQLTLGARGLLQRDVVDSSNGFSGRQSLHTQFAGVGYPLDRYHRLEAVTAVVTDVRYPAAGARDHADGRLGSVSFVRDTVGGRYLVPTYGSRLRLNYQQAVETLGGNVKYHSYSAVAHQYLPTGGASAFAFRAFGGNSSGRDAQQYALGGLGGLRGYGSSTVDNIGNRALLGTAEWRFPIYDRLDYYMWFMFPDFYFKAITAAVFTDAGYAWNTSRDLATAQWRTVRHSYGAGLRVHFFILQLVPLVLHLDYARATTAGGGGIFYVYLGPLF